MAKIDEQFIEQCRGSMQAAVMDTEKRPDLFETLREGVKLAGGVDFFPGSLVCIKPNLTTGKSAEGSGITTPCDVVETVVRLINQQTDNSCDIAIVESDSDGRIEETFEALGFNDLARKYGNVRLVDLGREKYYKIIMPDWAKARLVEVPEILFNMRHFINVANLKRHIQERVSFNWKNVYGLPSNHLVRMRYHQFLSEILFDLNYLFWPDLAIVDARIGLAGTGPMTGYPVFFGKLIVGCNPLATDLAAMRLIGESCRKAPMLRYAVRRLNLEPTKLRIVGDAWNPMSLPFVSPLIFNLMRLGLWLRRFATFFENVSLLSWLAGIALRMGKPSDFAGGGVQSLGTSVRVAWKMFRTIDLSEKVYE